MPVPHDAPSLRAWLMPEIGPDVERDRNADA